MKLSDATSEVADIVDHPDRVDAYLAGYGISVDDAVERAMGA